MGERSAEHAVDVVERYHRACTESRADDVADLFAENAELRDPLDGQTITGREAIRAFFKQGVDMIDLLTPVGPVRVTADAASAAVPFRAEVTIEGSSLEMDTIDVFFFDEDGLVSAMHAFYGPSNVRPR
jgi:steroid delta-isomerase